MTTTQNKLDARQLKRVLRPWEASEYLGLSRSALAKRRVYGLPPRYLSLGRAVGYLIEDLDQFIESCRRSSTSARDDNSDGGA
jgi:predicted DNA-binding transcriptional regulator AlpA